MLSTYIRTHILGYFSNEHYFNTTPNESHLAAIDQARSAFPFKKNIDHHVYTPKQTLRYKLVKAHFDDAFDGSIADIGDRNGAIQEFARGDVSTVDKNNTDLALFDWDASLLPFRDRQFDAVFCLDTLEHIADVHTRFADLLRVSKKYAIISLPNCWKKTVKEMVRGRSVRNSYGLPVEKPMDRHRWYMNTEEIEDFLFYNAAKNGYLVEGVVYHVPITAWWHRIAYILANVLPERYYKNFFVTNVVVKLRRAEQ